MAQTDRQIPAKERCATCEGAGWRWWTPDDGSEPRWIVCRDCIGTGRTDHNGRKRLKPEDD